MRHRVIVDGNAPAGDGAATETPTDVLRLGAELSGGDVTPAEACAVPVMPRPRLVLAALAQDRPYNSKKRPALA